MCKRLFILFTSFVFVLSLVGTTSGQPTGQILFEYWFDIGTVDISALTSDPRFPDSPDDSELLDKFEGPVDWKDNYGSRARGFVYPPADGDYTFWISGDDYEELYLSTDDDPANAALIAEVPGWTQHLEWYKYPEQQSAPITLVGGQKYYIEGIMKEAGGGDSMTVGWAGPEIGEELVILDGAYLSHWLRPAARGPVPADGTIDYDGGSVEWSAGDGAVSHKVFLSADATIDDADLVAETDLTIYLATLDPGMDYYWRVDEVDADGAVTEGKVWSFTTLPLEAHFPSPADGAVEVKSGTQLSWTAGKGVIMHDVYFGTDETAVAAADPSTFKGKVMVTSFDPGAFEGAVTYYWKIDEFSVTGTNPGPVWSFTAFDPDVASEPDPADGATNVDNLAVLSWAAGETATSYDVYFGTDVAMVDAGDASVFQGQQSEIGFATAEALDRGITYYWKVDVVTADGKMHPGKVWRLTVVDRNTNNWAATVVGDSPAYLDTFVEDGLYDIGELSGDITYEFVVLSNPDETEASMALIGRRQFGDTQAGLKFDQWNNTGEYGATIFGVVDLYYGIANNAGEYTHLAFVSSEDAGTTALYINGALAGSVDRAITLSGIVGIGYGAQGEDMTGSFDNFDGTIFGVAIYDEALSDDVIARHSDSYFTPITITDPDLLIYYDFESGEGLTVVDRSGHGNHSLFFGNPAWVAGKFGGAIDIERAEVDYIQTVAPLNIVTNTITVSGWVKHDELPQPWSGILTHRGTDPGSFGLQHNGEELRYMWGPDIYWDISTGLTLPNGEWYFAAIAISPDQAKFYLNGIGEGQTFTNVAEHVPTNFDSLIRVGRDHNDDRIMTSQIDEVRFYNRTLTDADIQKLVISTDADVQALVLADVTGPGDIVRGVPDDGDWPGAETPDLAIDDDTGTKYLHFKGEVQPTGFQVEPAIGATIVTGMTFTTANDAEPRDPVTFELSGSNESMDGPYELIAAGDIADFAMANAWPRFTRNARAISFDNTRAYAYYQVMFPTVRDAANANSMQIAEVELLHVPGLPEPVAHWTLDDGAGTVALDSSGNANDGTLVGDPQWVEGKIGGTLEFDGDGDYVDCGNAELLDITGDITVACWIKVDVFDKNWQAIVTHGDNSWRVHRSSSSNNIAWGTSGASPADITGTTNVNDAEWHHIAGVYNGAQKFLYVDGAVDASADFAGNINSSTYNVNIGENNQATGRYFAGLIDDVRIYNQALSEAQIGKVSGLVASVKINFQQTGGDVPEGYLPDGGEVFGDRGNGYSYGWNMDSTGGARNRNNPDAPDERYDTTQHLEKGEHRIWEIELPNGTYDLLVACGDVNHTDQTNNMDIEGVIVNDPDGEDNFDEYTLTVDVTDGRLTIQMAEGASNAKIMFVDIN